ncbi:PAS domain S-box protein (plasmid) [Deinococcus taeanensis]|uniref:PAS domain S-box protein n=1 Tax=Deinococcus taeanensis TaxID=2737050 RepID=UPI001CDD5E3C|nr:PAS domain S-box protein [Deinococcus taeanensis]UBV44525.1 PAS domain S-box protein [Deinococcus taeanensis]
MLTSVHFQALVEHSADLLILLGSDGRVRYLSPSAQRHAGCPPTCTAEGCPFALDQVHPDDRARVTAQVLRSPPGVTTALLPYRARHASGRWRWLAGTAINLLNDPQVRGLLMQVRDVTGQVQAEQRARAWAGLSTALASTTTTDEVVQVILLQGLEAMGADAGGVVLLEPGGQHVTVLGSAGFPERIERPWRRFPADAPVPAADALRQGQDLFMTGEDWSTLYPHLQHVRSPTTGATAVLTLRIHGRITGAITLAFAEDRPLSEADRQHLRSVAAQCALALERGELHARLEQQERRFRKLTEYSGDLVSVVTPSGHLQYVSPQIQRILGFTPEERRGVNVFDSIHPEDRARVMHAFHETVRSRQPRLVTYRCQHQAGHWVWLESTGTDATGDPDLNGVVLNTRDVTARMAAEEARRASERRLQLFEEHSDMLIHILSPEGRCLYASPAVRTMLGYAPEELTADGVKVLIHPDDLPAVQAAWAARTELPVYRIRRQDGTYVWVETVTRTVTDAAGHLTEVHAATRDVTSRVNAEEALRRQLRRFQHLVDLTADFAAQDGAEQHMQTALERCLDLTPYAFGFYFPVGGDTLIEPLRAGQATDAMLPWTLPMERLHRNGEVGRALRHHTAFFAGPSQAVFTPPEPLPRPVWTSLAVLPVVARGALRGFMAFGTNEAVDLDDDTRRLLLGVSEQASRAVERSVHFDELRQSREETLRALGLALEYRDYETKGHTDRVVTLTEQLGQALGFTGHDLDALRWGAFLHDTGKVAIPDAILLKPGQLDPHEWAVIKRHPSIGYEMLHHIPSLPPGTLEVVLYHQERWNGSGYPRGLAGTDIPLAARVFAVVDVYDALTSERPYKTAWTHQDAAAQLRREAGVLLDARVVDAFLQLPVFGEAQQAHNHDRHSP